MNSCPLRSERAAVGILTHSMRVKHMTLLIPSYHLPLTIVLRPLKSEKKY